MPANNAILCCYPKCCCVCRLYVFCLDVGWCCGRVTRHLFLFFSALCQLYVGLENNSICAASIDSKLCQSRHWHIICCFVFTYFDKIEHYRSKESCNASRVITAIIAATLIALNVRQCTRHTRPRVINLDSNT